MAPLDWPSYDSYQDSGFEWLDAIPAGWIVKRLKHVTRQVSDKVSSADISLPYIGMENVESWSGRLVEGGSEVEGLAAKFSAGDVIFGKLRPYLAKAAKLEFPGMCSTEFIVFRTTPGLEPDFLAYLLRSAQFVSFVDSSTYGSKMPRANPSFIANCPVGLPPPQEQRVIAAFLDEKCAKVDEAVRIKEEQIALLRERRQILIQEAVTRGLNPDAPMKDSGIEWIGEIPEQWEVKRFTKEVYVQEGPGIMAADFQDKGVPLVRISGVRTRVVTLEGCNYLDPAKVRRKWEHFLLKEGDLVISGSASTGLVAEVGKEAIGAILYTGLMKLRIINSDALSKSYLEYFLSSKAFDTQVDLLKAGSTISHYGPSHLGKMFIIVPPWDEQIEVATYCAGESERIESAIAIKNEQIAALKEYKTTLINAAVTGKIKVA